MSRRNAEQWELVFRLNWHDYHCDVLIEHEDGRVVFIAANTVGRRALDDLYPGLEWTTDPTFQCFHNKDWLYTRIRITSLPSCFEAITPLQASTGSQLAYVTANAIQAKFQPMRVMYHTAEEGFIRFSYESDHGPPEAWQVGFDPLPADVAVYLPALN
jgi:hypothetical protein